METLYVIGDKDGLFQPHARLSKMPIPNADEHIWGKIETDSMDRLLSWVDEMFGGRAIDGRTYSRSPHVIMGRIEAVLDDGGCLADGEFSIVKYDWHAMGSVTTLSRSFRRG